jgi:endonuclease/exonuclease/phosphatase family metal-dependent hydrolase
MVRLATAEEIGAVAPYGEAGHSIAIDADFGDWAQHKSAACDDRYVYLRFTTEKPLSLQQNDKKFALQLDLDANATTGKSSAVNGDHRLGADLEVQFWPAKPLDANDRRRPTSDDSNAIRVATFAGDSATLDLGPGDIDLMYAPTYLASDFELRFSRELAERLTGVDIGPTLRGAFVATAAPADANRALEAFELNVAPAREKTLPDVSVPSAANDSIRIVSYNMLGTATFTNAEAFGRLLQALKPDVLLVQEWPRGGHASEGWFRQYVEPDTAWHALTANDVAIVSRFDILPVFPAGEFGEQRVVMGRVQTPDGPLVAVSTHLKCCGSPTSREELKRQAEAKTINSRLRKLVASERLPLVIGGDMNLVGTRQPISLLCAGLDANGTDLKVAEGLTLGDGAYYTWRDHIQGYSPARLDWLLYSRSSLQATSCFAFDPGRLSSAALERIGVRRDDGLASDHLPLVLDVRPANGK